jgi:creatinine amidohydrolase
MTAWAALPWGELEQEARGRVALLPLGAIEEHGPHIALGADWHAAQELGRRVAEAAGLVLLPALPYGQVWSLSGYPGTLSVSTETLVSLVTDLASGLRLAGITGVVLLSCHLGNMSALKEAARRMYEFGLPSLYLFYPGMSEASSSVRTTPEVSREIVHADEIETSVLLELAPQDVDMTKAVAEWPGLPEDLLSSPEQWRDFSSSGVFGDPTEASLEKGRAIMALVERRAVELIGGWRARHGL